MDFQNWIKIEAHTSTKQTTHSKTVGFQSLLKYYPDNTQWPLYSFNISEEGSIIQFIKCMIIHGGMVNGASTNWNRLYDKLYNIIIWNTFVVQCICHKKKNSVLLKPTNCNKWLISQCCYFHF